MSVLGQAVRTYLSAATGYAAALPGGIAPDQAAQATESKPFAVYQSVGRVRSRTVTGTVVSTMERIQLSVVGETRASAQTSANWIANKIAAEPGRKTVGSLFIHCWQVDDESSTNEPYADGSDESARIITLEISGTYSE